MLMHKILQNHLLYAFVANLKIVAIYALYPESFCDKNLAIRKVFAFCDSEGTEIDFENNAVTNTMCYIIDYISPVSAIAAQKNYDSKFAYLVCSIFLSLMFTLGYVNPEKSSFAPD